MDFGSTLGRIQANEPLVPIILIPVDGTVMFVRQADLREPSRLIRRTALQALDIELTRLSEHVACTAAGRTCRATCEKDDNSNSDAVHADA